MTRSLYFVCALPLLIALSAAIGPAAASPVNDHWIFNDGPPPLIGVVDPDDNDLHTFVFLMECQPDRRTVILSQDTGVTRSRSTALPLFINGSPISLRAKPVYMEMDESWALEATVGYGSPQLQQVLAAKSLGLGGSLATQRLPAKQFQMSMAKWAKACKLK